MIRLAILAQQERILADIADSLRNHNDITLVAMAPDWGELQNILQHSKADVLIIDEECIGGPLRHAATNPVRELVTGGKVILVGQSFNLYHIARQMQYGVKAYLSYDGKRPAECTGPN